MVSPGVATRHAGVRCLNRLIFSHSWVLDCGGPCGRQSSLSAFWGESQGESEASSYGLGCRPDSAGNTGN